MNIVLNLNVAAVFHQLTINLDQNADFLFSRRVLCHQSVLASIIAVNLIDYECGGLAGDFNETSIMEVYARLAPRDGGSGSASNIDKQAQGTTSTEADGLLQIIVELKVRCFFVKIQ